jgi:hypothetical protein
MMLSGRDGVIIQAKERLEKTGGKGKARGEALISEAARPG